MNKETNFIKKIDCALPYDNEEAITNLINEAFELTSNCMFKIIEELCRIPNSKRNKMSTATILKRYNHIDNIFSHPLKRRILDIARQMVMGRLYTSKEVLLNMDEVKNYPNQYSALNIVYFSSSDITDEIDNQYERIISDWKSGNVI